MTNSQRAMRRIKIASVVTVSLALVGTALYYLLRPVATCFDGIQNQKEGGVDCGGSCSSVCAEVFAPEAFIIREAAFVPGNSSSEYDALAKVRNQNGTIGAAEIGYDFILRDAVGIEVGRVSGSDSILPQETKTLIAIGIKTSGVPVTVEVSFRDATWQRFSGYQERPQLTLYQMRFAKISSGAFYGEALGTLRNDSTFDFRSVTVKVVLRDATGKPVALNQTEVATLISGDIRDFTLKFPKAFPGEVATVEAEAGTDFYHQDNFIQRYRSGNTQFQKLR